MNKYQEFKINQEKKFNEFPMMFAFSNEQFENGKIKLGINNNNELLSIGGGGYIRKTDREAFDNLYTNLDQELINNLNNDDEFLYQAFIYELANHEYCISCDLSDTMDCLGLNINKVRNDLRMNNILNKAIKEYRENCY